MCIPARQLGRSYTPPGVSNHPQNKTRNAKRLPGSQIHRLKVLSHAPKNPHAATMPQLYARTRFSAQPPPAFGAYPAAKSRQKIRIKTQCDLSPGFMNRTISTEKPDIISSATSRFIVCQVSQRYYYTRNRCFFQAFSLNLIKKFITNFNKITRAYLVIVSRAL